MISSLTEWELLGQWLLSPLLSLMLFMTSFINEGMNYLADLWLHRPEFFVKSSINFLCIVRAIGNYNSGRKLNCYLKNLSFTLILVCQLTPQCLVHLLASYSIRFSSKSSACPLNRSDQPNRKHDHWFIPSGLTRHDREKVFAEEVFVMHQLAETKLTVPHRLSCVLAQMDDRFIRIRDQCVFSPTAINEPIGVLCLHELISIPVVCVYVVMCLYSWRRCQDVVYATAHIDESVAQAVRQTC